MRALGLLEAVNGRNVRVVERRKDACLRLEPREALCFGGKLGWEDTSIATSRPSFVSCAR